MGIILFAWELGSGIGHVTQIGRLAKELKSAGHHVVAALRELSRVEGLLDYASITLVQSPYRRPTNHNNIAIPRTYAHVLWNAGHSDPIELERLVGAWNNLFDTANPDLIVFDHAPTALLAAHGRKARRVILGNVFCCPPDCSPLPDLRSWLPPALATMLQDERRVLDNMNQVLERRKCEPLARITQLYGQVDDTILTTLAEFDHFPSPGSTRYYGPWSLPGGEAPVWPTGRGKRIYAYLGRFPAGDQFLAQLARIGNPTIISVAASDLEAVSRFAAPNIRFEARHLDLKQVAAECDMAILNGNHATSIIMLLAGKPILQIPIFLEQTHNALATVRLGAGLICSNSRPDEIAMKLDMILNDERYAEAARRFATKYTSFDPQAEVEAALHRIEELLA